MKLSTTIVDLYIIKYNPVVKRLAVTVRRLSLRKKVEVINYRQSRLQ